MISISKYQLIPSKDSNNRFYVKSQENSICPRCENIKLKVIGSRKRTAWKGDGSILTLVIRRLNCCNCHKTHHELPDLLVPYKRYVSAVIESILDDNTTEICCENSSISRIKSWFAEVSKYMAGCLNAIAIRLGLETKLQNSLSAYRRIKIMMGETSGWLAKAVRTMVNTNNWVHTRSAFLT